MERKHLLGLRGVSATEIVEILDTAQTMKLVIDAPNKKTAHLTGRSILTLFYENSTRTRMSFELAGKYMSAAMSNMSVATSSVAKGETLIDTGKTLDQMGIELIVMRHSMSGAPHLLSKHVKAGIINAGDGMNEHPTQALLDMLTMREAKGEIKGLQVAIVGDALHSRVVRSNLWGLQTMGATVTVAGPRTLVPAEFADMGARVTSNVREAVEGADVIMGLRIQKERQKDGLFPSVREYADFFGINQELVNLADQEAIVMHPGPMNRGVEITSEVADAANSMILEQVKNGVAIRMALLYMLTRREACLNS